MPQVEFIVNIHPRQGIELRRLIVQQDLAQDLSDMLIRTEERMSKLDQEVFFVDKIFNSTQVCTLTKDNEHTGRFYDEFMTAIGDIYNLGVFDESIEKSQVDIYGLICWNPNNTYTIGLRRRKVFNRSIKKTFLNLSGHKLKRVSKQVFYLDDDFECLVTDQQVRSIGSQAIYRILDLNHLIEEQFPEHLTQIEEVLPWLDLERLKEPGSFKKRIAALTMKIVTTGEHETWGQEKFKELLDNADIEIVTNKGKLAPADGYELKFLQAIAKNIYRIEVKEGEYENRSTPHSQRL